MKIDDIDHLGEHDSVPIVVAFFAAGNELDGRVNELQSLSPLASGFSVCEGRAVGRREREGQPRRALSAEQLQNSQSSADCCPTCQSPHISFPRAMYLTL